MKRNQLQMIRFVEKENKKNCWGGRIAKVEACMLIVAVDSLHVERNKVVEAPIYIYSLRS